MFPDTRLRSRGLQAGSADLLSGHRAVEACSTVEGLVCGSSLSFACACLAVFARGNLRVRVMLFQNPLWRASLKDTASRLSADTAVGLETLTLAMATRRPIFIQVTAGQSLLVFASGIISTPKLSCFGFPVFVVQPENLLLVDKQDNANLKIADFGFAKKHDARSEVLKTQCGTPGCKMNVDTMGLGTWHDVSWENQRVQQHGPIHPDPCVSSIPPCAPTPKYVW